MHRAPLLQLLNSYRTNWPAETETADRLIGFVESNTDCFERALSIGHITGSAWVVNKAGMHVLLTHHRKLNMWLQLGGHVDGNPDVLEAAMREALEESGLTNLKPVSPEIFDIDIHLIPERKNESAHYHHDIRFTFQVAGSEDYVVSDESHDLAWVEISHLSEVTTEESMLRMAAKWLLQR
ncbi:MAG: NUDIX hydrolase [Pontiella sp.]